MDTAHYLRERRNATVVPTCNLAGVGRGVEGVATSQEGLSHMCLRAASAEGLSFGSTLARQPSNPGELIKQIS